MGHECCNKRPTALAWSNYPSGSLNSAKWSACLTTGKTMPQIRDLNQAENIFAAPTQTRDIRFFNMVEKRLQDERCTILKGYGDVKLMALLAIKRWLWDEMEKTHNLTELYAARRRIFPIVMEVSGEYLAYIGLLFRESKHM